MKKIVVAVVLILLLTCAGLAQGQAAGGQRVIIKSDDMGPVTLPAPHAKGGYFISRGPMMAGPPGKWWKDSEVVQKLGLNDAQVKRIEQIFQDSRLRLIDVRAALEREEARLEPMVEADNPDETQVLAQIDKVAAQRAELERTNARMLLSIRKVLTPEQWKKLQGMRGDVMYRQFPDVHMEMHGPGMQMHGGPGEPPMPPLPPGND